jgi:hypothetical protein
VSEPDLATALSQRTSLDDVIDLYKKDVDRTLLVEAVKLTPAERVAAMLAALRFSDHLRAGIRRTRG